MARGLTPRRVVLSVLLVVVAIGVGNVIRIVLKSMAEEPEKSAQFDLRVVVRTSISRCALADASSTRPSGATSRSCNPVGEL